MERGFVGAQKVFGHDMAPGFKLELLRHAREYTSISSHSGWVHISKRLMAATPWATHGITTSAQMR